MPGMSGLDLCLALRSRRETCHIPIILHTALEVPADGKGLYQLVLSKPAELAGLATTIRTMLPHL